MFILSRTTNINKCIRVRTFLHIYAPEFNFLLNKSVSLAIRIILCSVSAYNHDGRESQLIPQIVF